MDNNALIVAEKLDVTVVFSDKGMAKLLDEIKTKVIAHVPNITTEQGRKDIISLAYKITRSKTLIDDLGKGVVADWKKKAKLIDEHRKTARDFLDDLKNTARQPLTDWEAEQAVIKEKEEAAEKERIQGRVDRLFSLNVLLPFMDVALLTEAEYTELIEKSQHAYDVEQLRIAGEQKAKEEEEAKLVIERAEIERIKAEQDAKAREQAEREEALKEQERALETAKRKEIERQEQIAWREREAERLRILAEADAAEKIAKAIEDARIAAEEAENARLLKEAAEKERVEREAGEKKEKEEAEIAEKRRLLEIAPDKDKLIVFANQLQDLTVKDLSLKSKKAQTLYNITQENLAVVIAGLRTKIGKL